MDLTIATTDELLVQAKEIEAELLKRLDEELAKARCSPRRTAGDEAGREAGRAKKKRGEVFAPAKVSQSSNPDADLDRARQSAGLGGCGGA
jgi:hypothetical protein